MKSVLRFFVVATVVAFFPGCYTELATTEQPDREYTTESDTSYENGNTTINNHYYLDDNYRRSRMSISFVYYYPTYSSWISSYYHSYFNDYYWGMYYRPSWYYDPFYPYYPPYGWCYAPTPYYDPWYPYYPPVAYYPSYNPIPGYANNPVTPGRPRTGGSTRDPFPDNRPRSNPTILPGTAQPVGGNTSTVEKPVMSPDPERGRNDAWWKNVVLDRPSQDPEPEVKPNNRPTLDRPVHETTDEQPVKNERPKKGESVKASPEKQSRPRDDARPAQRPRENPRPSYNPPVRHSSPDPAPPSRSGGGSNTSSGNGRKRN